MTDTERPYYNPYIIEGPCTAESATKLSFRAQRATQEYAPKRKPDDPPAGAEWAEPCFFCGQRTIKPITNSSANHELLQDNPLRRIREHLQPICKGGNRPVNDPNVVWACKFCNNDKHQLTLDEYRVVIAYRRGALQAMMHDHDFFGPNSLFKFPGEQVAVA